MREFAFDLVYADAADGGTGGNESVAADDHDAADADRDAGSDADRDAGSDADRDAGSDADRDAGSDDDHDAGSDADHDAADAGHDAGDDVGVESPATLRGTGVTSTGMGGCLGDGRFWRVERLEGPSDALDRVTDRLRADPAGIDRLTERDCTADVTVEQLGRTKGTRELYVRVDRVDGCKTVYTLAARYADPDALFEFERAGGTETWRVLLNDDGTAGVLYDAIQAVLRPGIRFEFGHVGEPSGWRTELVSHLDIPSEQRSALDLAVERGYYETPRQVTLDELAETLDWPRSTLSYRLRRAEARLVKAFSARGEALSTAGVDG